MQGEPTAYRIVDPGIRALLTEASRFQAWLDVEAALAQAQAELGIIPSRPLRKLRAKRNSPSWTWTPSGVAWRGPDIRSCRSSGNSIGCVRAMLVAMYTGGRRRRTSPRRACCCCYGKRMTFFSSNWRPCWTFWPIWPSAQSRCSFRAHAWPACRPGHVWLQSGYLDRRSVGTLSGCEPVRSACLWRC